MANNTYKIIAFLLKTVTTVVVFVWLYSKLNHHFALYHPSDLLLPAYPKYAVLSVLLVLLNWGLEAIKWQSLVRLINPAVTWKGIVTSLLSGIALSILTPNRNGEFIGRAYTMEEADKIRAGELAFVASLCQQLCTVGMGCVGVCYLSGFGRFIPYSVVLLVFLLVLLFASHKLELILNKVNFFKNKLGGLHTLTRAHIGYILVLSLFRYIVFTFQFFLMLKAYGLAIPANEIFIVITVVFYAGSYLPSFALLEMGVKSAIAVYCFGMFTTQTFPVINASVSIWFINVALPALAGVVCLYQPKFKKDA